MRRTLLIAGTSLLLACQSASGRPSPREAGAEPGDAPADAASDGTDAGSVDPGRPSQPRLATLAERLRTASAGTPPRLSETGLYVDIGEKRLADGLVELTPRYPLWSDGASKRRWLWLPPGTSIDTRDPDRWDFPVGTLALKEFRGDDGRLLETRLIARTGPGPDDFWMGAFVWGADEADAVFAREGASDVRGTAHDVPSAQQCETCHRGEAARLLGFSEVQLTEIEPRLLSRPRPEGASPLPDTPAGRALGYLHANCGHCHNPAGSARPDTDLDLRLPAGARDLTRSPSYLTSIGVPLQYFAAAEGALRVVPGDPARSALLQRMGQRGDDTQMPPLASERVDPQGLESVRQWIEGLELSGASP